MSAVQDAVNSGVRGWGDLRPEVKAMAILMEHELRMNHHKGGWKGCEPRDLYARLREEAGELYAEIDPRTREALPAEARSELSGVGSEAADVANFAMMIADVEGDLDITALP
jgi:NTP pyrophosphatase (non-canonical NTP hydrolase)